MYSFFTKQIYILVLLVICLFMPNCALFKKDPTSVEQAEKLISKDRQRRKNKATKSRKATIKSHWSRQSKAAKKTMKSSEKEKKKIDRIKKKNVKRRKKRFG